MEEGREGSGRTQAVVFADRVIGWIMRNEIVTIIVGERYTLDKLGQLYGVVGLSGQATVIRICAAGGEGGREGRRKMDGVRA